MLGPLALRGRLGSGFVRSIACACYRTVAQIKDHTRVQKYQDIRVIFNDAGSFDIKTIEIARRSEGETLLLIVFQISHIKA